MVESTNSTSQQPTIDNMNNLEQPTNPIEIGLNNDPISTNSSYIEDPTTVGRNNMFDEWLTNDLVGYISEGDQEKYVSPSLSSTMTTPTNIGFDTISTPQDLIDSPLFGSGSTSFSGSPTLEPVLDFFPDFSFSELTFTEAFNSPLIKMPSITIPNDLIQTPSLQYATAVSPTISEVSSTSGRGRKRPLNDAVPKDPVTLEEEMAIKRAKNTDAARRSRLRKVEKMQGLEREVANLKSENAELQTRVAVLESEKKGLEEKNSEKDARVRQLELQLNEILHTTVFKT